MLTFGLASYAQVNKTYDKKAESEKVEKFSTKDLITDAAAAKAELIKDNAEIKTYFDTAEAYVIFPNVGKGAFIVGAASGRGIVYENGIPTGMAKMKKVDIGLQAGGKAFSEVIFFETESALQEFKRSEFEFDANASAVILKSGKAFNAQYEDGVAVFAKPKAGLMVDASVGGQKFEYMPITTDSE